MRILYINADPGVPVLGRKGCSTHVREVCAALGRRGHQVFCITANAGIDEAGADGADGLPFELHELAPFRARWLGSDLRRLLYNLRLQSTLAGFARQFPPDLIYERYALYGTAGQVFAERQGVPHMLEVNTHLAREQAHRLHFGRLAERYEKAIWRGADRVVAVSTPLGEELVADGHVPRDRLRVMPMAVDVERFRPEAAESAGHPARGHRPEGWTAVIYAGALTTWHGVDVFFDLARAWRDAGDRIRLLALGGDPPHVEEGRRRTAEEDLGEHLVFLGAVPYDAVPGYLASSDIGFIAHTSPYSSPTKMFEYMACGLPTVAPDQPAIREVLTPGETGLLFQPEHPDSAIEAIRRLAADADLRRRLGAAARRQAADRHSWDEIARQIEAFAPIRNPG